MTGENLDADWNSFAADHRTGDLLVATVTRTLPFGALVSAQGVAGLLTGVDGLAVGDRVQGRIAALDPAGQRFSLTR